MTESTHLRTAVEALGDRMATDELRVCVETLRLESDIGIRRVAQARFFSLKDKQELSNVV